MSYPKELCRIPRCVPLQATPRRSRARTGCQPMMWFLKCNPEVDRLLIWSLIVYLIAVHKPIVLWGRTFSELIHNLTKFDYWGIIVISRTSGGYLVRMRFCMTNIIKDVICVFFQLPSAKLKYRWTCGRWSNRRFRRTWRSFPSWFVRIMLDCFPDSFWSLRHLTIW